MKIENRRKFILKANVPDFEFNGIIGKDGQVTFPKPHFDNSARGRFTFATIDQCQEWLKSFQEKHDMKFSPNAKMTKQFLNVDSKGIEITDQEWEKMLVYIKHPDMVKREDFVSFKANLANNVIDRDADRFSLDVLQSFNRSIVGKSKLTGHNWYGLGEGRVYDSSIIKYKTVDDFLPTLGFTPHKRIQKMLEEFLEIDGTLAWLQPKYYMHVVDQDQITRIAAGIVSDVSIGFRAAERVAVKDEKSGNFRYYEFRNTSENESEALEMSHVYLGAQYGSNDTKYFAGADFIPDAGDPDWDEKYISTLEDECFAYTGQDLPNKNHTLNSIRLLPHHRKGAKGSDDDVDIPLLKTALVECFAKLTGELDDSDRYRYVAAKEHLQKHAAALKIKVTNGETKMPFTLKIFGPERKFDLSGAENYDVFVQEIDKAFDDVNGKLETSEALIKSVKEALGLNGDAEINVDDIKALVGSKELVGKYNHDLIEQIAAFAFNSGQKEYDQLEEYKAELSGKNIDELLTVRKGLRDEFAKTNKGKRQIDPEFSQPENDEKDAKFDVATHRPNSHFQHIY